MIELLVLILLYSLSMIVKQYYVSKIEKGSDSTIIQVIRNHNVVYEIIDDWKNHPDIVNEIANDYSLDIRLATKMNHHEKSIKYINNFQRYLVLATFLYLVLFSLFLIFCFLINKTDTITIEIASEISFSIFMISMFFAPIVEESIPYIISYRQQSMMKKVQEQMNFKDILNLNSKICEIRHKKIMDLDSNEKIDDMFESIFKNGENKKD